MAPVSPDAPDPASFRMPRDIEQPPQAIDQDLLAPRSPAGPRRRSSFNVVLNTPQGTALISPRPRPASVGRDEAASATARRSRWAPASGRSFARLVAARAPTLQAIKEGRRRYKLYIRPGLTFVFLALACGLTYLKYRLMLNDEENLARLFFAATAENAFQAVINQWTRSLMYLELMTNHYLTQNGSVSRTEFADFSNPNRYWRSPVIQGVAYVPIGTPENRAAFEAEGKAYKPNFQWTERDASNALIRAGQRPLYFPVQFIEPYKGNEAALGFDLYSNPVRAATIDKARTTGVTACTPRITLVQSTKSQYGVIVFEPVFLNAATGRLDRTFQGPGSLHSLIDIVFRMDEMMAASVDGITLRNIDLYLYDVTTSPPAYLTTLSGDGAPSRTFAELSASSPDTIEGELRDQVEFSAADRRWRIIAVGRPGYIRDRRTDTPNLVLGLSVAMLAVTNILAVVKASQRLARNARLLFLRLRARRRASIHAKEGTYSVPSGPESPRGSQEPDPRRSRLASGRSARVHAVLDEDAWRSSPGPANASGGERKQPSPPAEPGANEGDADGAFKKQQCPPGVDPGTEENGGEHSSRGHNSARSPSGAAVPPTVNLVPIDPAPASLLPSGPRRARALPPLVTRPGVPPLAVQAPRLNFSPPAAIAGDDAEVPPAAAPPTPGALATAALAAGVAATMLV